MLELSPPPLFATAAAGSSGALWTFIGYSVAVFVVALFASRLLSKKSFLGEYFLGSRGLGVIAFTLTFGATSASAGSFGGFPALIYTHGWVLALWIAGYMVMPLCGMGLFGKRLNQVARRSGAITIPDVFRERFQCPALALTATGLMIFMLLFFLVPQFKIAAIILRTLLADASLLHTASVALAGWTRDVPFLASADPEYLICLFLFALITVAYTSFGGFRAVVWTDVLQGFVMIFGVICMLTLALWQVGGLAGATRQMAHMTTPRLGKVVFEWTGPPLKEPLRVPADTWFQVERAEFGARSAERTSENSALLLMRSNELAVIPAGRRVSNEVKAVAITTPEEAARIKERAEFGVRNAEWASQNSALRTPRSALSQLSPRVVELRDYKYGANQPGVYLTAPGPSRDNALGFLPVGLAISFFFFWPLSGTGQPGNLVRLMAFDNARTLSRSIALLTFYFGLIYFPLVVIFCCARLLVPGLDNDPDRIMPAMAFQLASGAGAPWLAGLLVAAPFAAAMSTVDSLMLMISSSVVRDIYQHNINPAASEKTIKRFSYLCTLLIGTVVMLGAVNPPMFLQYLIVFTGGGLSVSFLMPMALAMYWRRANRAGMMAAMLGGLAVYLELYLAGFWIYGTNRPVSPLSLDPLLWGFAASFVCGVGVSLATPPPPRALVSRFFERDEEKGAEPVTWAGDPLKNESRPL